MYVVNPSVLDTKKLYSCKERIAKWLIYEKHLSPFGKDETQTIWYFVRTEKLEQAIKEMPILLKF